MRKAFYLVPFIVIIAIAVISCQKEFSIDLTPATASIKDSSGNCLPAVVKGNYKADTALTAANFIELTVNFTQPGDYLIQTNTVNGFSFKVQGIANAVGLQTVRLEASGKPVAPGTFTFDISYNDNNCPVDVVVTDGANLATYSLKDTTGNCPSITVKGGYMQAYVTDTSNYVFFNVHVTKTGPYALQTETKNGISFSGSGNFTDTGMQKVTMNASGTPTAAGDYNFSIANNGNSCSFPVTFKPESNEPAAYSINCASAALGGAYVAGGAMTAANTATITVVVSKPGKYSITTTTVNGINFTASGKFTSASASGQPVILTAKGTGTAKGNFTYPVTADGNTCSFQVPFTGPAEFSLTGAPGTCAATINGVYNKGVAVTTDNYVVIKANVTATGNYNIATNTVNGISFSAAGTFSATGEQEITLTGKGTPVEVGDFSFTPQVGNACSFDVKVITPAVDPGKYSCKIDGVLTNFNDRAKAENEDLFGSLTLMMEGYVGPPNGSSVTQLQLFVSNNNNNPVKTGSYNVDGYLSPGYRIEVDYVEVQSEETVIRWNTSSSVLSPNPPFTINITSITSNRIKGTFSGEVTDLVQGGTKRKKITEGTFDLPLK